MKMYPQFLRERGYYCTNNSKEDYNLDKPGKVWDESSGKAHWKNRQPGQPFFAIFNITVTHESQIRDRPHTLKHDPAKVRVPAYHPDTPEVRHDWAQYYDKVTEMDAQAGQRLQELDEAGLADDTIVFFYGDHGSGMPRSKRWPYNSGLHVPLIVHVPPKFRDLAPAEYQAGRSVRAAGGLRRPGPDAAEPGGRQAARVDAGPRLHGPAATPPQPLRVRLPRAHGRALRPGPLGAQRALRLHPQLHAAPDLRPAHRLHVPDADHAGLEAAVRRGQTAAAADLLLGAQAGRGTLRPADRPGRGPQPGRLARASGRA